MYIWVWSSDSSVYGCMGKQQIIMKSWGNGAIPGLQHKSWCRQPSGTAIQICWFWVKGHRWDYKLLNKQRMICRVIQEIPKGNVYMYMLYMIVLVLVLVVLFCYCLCFHNSCCCCCCRGCCCCCCRCRCRCRCCCCCCRCCCCCCCCCRGCCCCCCCCCCGWWVCRCHRGPFNLPGHLCSGGRKFCRSKTAGPTGRCYQWSQHGGLVRENPLREI